MGARSLSLCLSVSLSLLVSGTCTAAQVGAQFHRGRRTERIDPRRGAGCCGSACEQRQRAAGSAARQHRRPLCLRDVVQRRALELQRLGGSGGAFLWVQVERELGVAKAARHLCRQVAEALGRVGLRLERQPHPLAAGLVLHLDGESDDGHTELNLSATMDPQAGLDCACAA